MCLAGGSARPLLANTGQVSIEMTDLDSGVGIEQVAHDLDGGWGTRNIQTWIGGRVHYQVQ